MLLPDTGDTLKVVRRYMSAVLIGTMAYLDRAVGWIDGVLDKMLE